MVWCGNNEVERYRNNEVEQYGNNGLTWYQKNGVACYWKNNVARYENNDVNGTQTARHDNKTFCAAPYNLCICDATTIALTEAAR